MINIKKGLDLPIGGKPEQSVSDSPAVSHVALLGTDYVGLRPSMAVEAGQKVKKGQVLFEDKKNPGTCFTAPAAGTVVAINRGERRCFQSLVIEVDPNGESVEFKKTSADRLLGLSSREVVDELVASGMWTALRTRPFDKVPAIGSLPHSIFITAIDTNPLAADPKVVISAQAEAFANGVKVLSRIGVQVYVCKGDYDVPLVTADNIRYESFKGHHPAGLAGVHIHHLDPVSENKTVWHIGYQDVIAIGHLFVEGELFNERVISIAGPNAKKPRLVKTLLGASVAELTANEIVKSSQGVRVISGTVLNGNIATGVFAYLGRYHQAVALLEEGNCNEFFLGNWMGLGLHRHSATRAFLANFLRPSKYTFNTALNGGPRAILPIGCYDKVLAPYEVEATMLLRAIDINDVDQAKLLGILELSEDDIALATYVCPGKNDFGPLLRRSLTKIEVEG